MFRANHSGRLGGSVAARSLLGACILILFAASLFSATAAAQEIPLRDCGGLPTIPVRAGDRSLTFLVDTAANATFLNVKSFPYGVAKQSAIANWHGTDSVIGREVSLDDLIIGSQHLKNLRLAAIDLSSMQQACGKRIDGVLGANLLEKLGMTIDLKNRVARFSGAARDEQAQFDELDRQLEACGQAFNRSDEQAFAGCLAPEIVLYTFAGSYHGRDDVMKYFAGTYFHRNPSAQLTLTPREHHLTGNLIWLEYELRIALPQQVIHARGTALFRNAGGSWLLLHMNHSLAYDE
jgi:ketosteroid isomerase-like protein